MIMYSHIPEEYRSNNYGEQLSLLSAEVLEELQRPSTSCLQGDEITIRKAHRNGEEHIPRNNSYIQGILPGL
jgi:hypothetical protein